MYFCFSKKIYVTIKKRIQSIYQALGVAIVVDDPFNDFL